MAMVRLDKAQAIRAGNIENVVSTLDMKNGFFINLGDYIGGDVYNVAQPDTDTLDTEEVLLVYAPEVMYDERLSNVTDFVIKAGETARAYHLYVGDVITLSHDLIDGTPEEGKFLVAKTDQHQLTVSNTGLSSDPDEAHPRFCAKIIEEDVLGYEKVKSWVVRVVRS